MYKYVNVKAGEDDIGLNVRGFFLFPSSSSLLNSFKCAYLNKVKLSLSVTIHEVQRASLAAALPSFCNTGHSMLRNI